MTTRVDDLHNELSNPIHSSVSVVSGSDLMSLPKVELHLHLDCSLSYEVVKRIKPSITPDEFRRKFNAPPKCIDLGDYLTRAASSIALMQTRRQLRLVTSDLFEQLKRDNVIYAEIRFAPLLHTEQGLSAAEVVDEVNRTTAQAIQETGIEARIILCTLRFYSEEQSMETIRLVEQFRDGFVAGFDIAADTTGNPIDPHIAAFQYARERSIPCTAHAGEVRGPDHVWDTLEKFGPSRLGHGVRSIEDPSLIEFLKESRIHLEICPTSNIQTNVYSLYSDHQIDNLYQSGISIGVNTDSRTISNITLSAEYSKLHKTFGWDVEEFLTCNRNALNTAFIPNNQKEKLMQRLYQGWRRFQHANNTWLGRSNWC